MSLCFLLTAGQGTRLKPYTEKTPKPCLPFWNLPLAYYGFYLAKQGGFDSFLMNKHHLPEQIETLAESLRTFSSSIETIDETKQLLGSGGGIWNARSLLKQQDYFLIANGDEVLFPQDDKVLSHLKEKHLNDDPLCTLLTCDHPDLLKSLKAVWVNNSGEVKGFGLEPPAQDLKPVHYTGYKIFSKRIFDCLPEGGSNIFYDVLVKAIAQGEKISTLHMEKAHWHETGNFQSFVQASMDVAQHNWSDLTRRWQFFNKPILEDQSTSEEIIKNHLMGVQK